MIMTYFLINVISDRTTQWNESFEIINSFLQRIDRNLLLDFSFGRYSGAPYPNARFEFRCNFSDDEQGKQKAEAILRALKEDGCITRFEDWVPFVRPISVIKGCEMATAWSLAFKEWMDSHPQIFDAYSNRKSKVLFFVRFIPILLRSYGFEASLISHDIDSSYLQKLCELADFCKSKCRYTLPTDPDVNFLERVLHHFLNCVHVNIENEEANIRFYLMYVGWLDTLIRDKLKVRG